MQEICPTECVVGSFVPLVGTSDGNSGTASIPSVPH